MAKDKKAETEAPAKPAGPKCAITGKDLANPVSSVHIQINESTYLACVAYFRTSSGGYTAVPIGGEAAAAIRKALAGLEQK